MPSLADVGHRLGDVAGSARRTWWRCPRRPGCAVASSSAMRIRFRQYIAIQLVPSDCSRWPPVGSGALRSKTPMLSRPEEAALEDVAAVGVLAVDPPGEVEQQLVEDALEERAGRRVAALLAVDLEDAPGRPGVHRRVDVAEGPLVGRQLAVRVHVPLARQQHAAAPWRTRGRPAPAGCSGRPGPRPRTRGTPTCRASR